jgi:hypothetical protein
MLAIAINGVTMARKPSVDLDEVIEMLRKGWSTQSVAEKFSVSRQAIDLHRRRFIREGRLEPKRASGHQPGLPESKLVGKRDASDTVATTVNSERRSTYDAGTTGPDVNRRTHKPGAVSLDGMIELVIEAFDSLRRVPVLEAELETYKLDYQKAAERILELERLLNKRNEQETRWRSVVPPGDNKNGASG